MIRSIIIAFILGCISCKKDAITRPHKLISVVDSIMNHGSLELVWHKRSNRAQICRGTFVYDAGVVFFIQEAKPNSKDEILSLDLETGDTLWVWDEGPYFNNYRYIQGNTLYFTAGTSVCAIDCMTGKTLWEYQPPVNLAYMSLNVCEMGVYVSYQDRKPNPETNESILFELDQNGQPTEIIRLNAYDRNGYTFNYDHVTPWQHPNGDIILFCESRSWNYGPTNKGKGEYIAVNASSQSIYHDWGCFFNEVDIGGRCYLDDHIVYIASGWNQVAALDLLNNEVEWVQTIPDEQSTASLMPIAMFADHVLLSIGNKGHINVFNKTTGIISHTINGIGNEWFSTAYQFNDGYCWFTSTEGLYKLNQNFEIVTQLLKEESLGTSRGSFTNGLDIGSDGKLYTTRGYDFVCLKQK